MLIDPLPTVLDVRRAAVRGTRVMGCLKPLELSRFLPLLANAEGKILVDMAFSRDEEHRYILHLAIRADIAVVCQRCLEVMPLQLKSDSALAIVWTDEEAVHLPKHLEPLIVEDAPCQLRQIVEDELILSMPSYNYHDSEDCKLKSSDYYSEIDPQEGNSHERPNPFNVLEQFKPGK